MNDLITEEKSLREHINEMIAIIDELAKKKLEPGSPCYNLQQSLIRAAERYEKSRYKHE